MDEAISKGIGEIPAVDWREALETTSDCVVLLDSKFNVIYVNSCTAEFNRTAASELIGRNHWDLWPETVGTQIESRYREVLSSGVADHFEHRYTGEDFDLWADIRVRPLQDGLAIFFRDVTADRRSKVAAREERNRIESAIRAASIGVWQCDLPLDSKPLNWSPQVKRHFGVAEDAEVWIDDFYRWLHPDDCEHVRIAVERSINELTPFDMIYRTLGPDGKQRYIRSTGNVFCDEDGTPYSYDGFTVELTETIEDQQAIGRAERASRSIVNGMAAPVIVIGSDRRVVASNEAWHNLHTGVGQGGEELGIFAKEFEVLNLDDTPLPTEEWPATKALQGETCDIFVKLVHRKSGREIVASHRGVPIEIEGERLAVITAHDLTDLMKIQESLRQSEEQYRFLAESSPVMVFTALPNGAVDYVNKRWHDYIGMDLTVAQEAEWRTVYPPEEYDAVIAKWLEAITAGERYVNEFRLRRKDGVFRWHLCHAEPLKDEAGNVLRYFGTAVDIHDQQVQEAALRFLSNLTEATVHLRDPEEIMRVTARMLGEHLAASRCAYCEVDTDNERLVNMLDWSPETPSISGVEFQLSQFGSFIADPLRKGVPVVSTNVGTDADPVEAEELRSIQVEALIALPLIKRGGLVAIMAVHCDKPRNWTNEEVELVRLVTERSWAEIERSRAERSVRKSEARLREILEAATVGVSVNDVAGVFTFANRPWLQLLGFTQKDLDAGKVSWKDIQLPELAEHDNKALEQLREAGVCEPFETELLASDGRRVPVYVGAAIISDENGQDIGAVFITDLTNLKIAQRELEALNAELDLRVRDSTSDLRAANEALEAYSHHVAHDLRAPLRAIISTSRILEQDFGSNLPREALELLDRQVQAASKLGQLIDDLLKSARLSREEMVRQRFSLSEIAHEAVAEALAAHPDTTVELDVQERMIAQGDPRLLRLAMVNLIENAVKYSPAGGKIKVGQQPDGTYFVSDQGIGIDMAYVDKIFEPFQRLHRDEEFAGTGIGLSNARQVIIRHGGKIWLESESGKGSTFFFTL